MKAKVFYFTGTGNSLIAAKTIAEGIGASIEPIARYQHISSVNITEDVVGIVFPVYLALLCGVPEIVRNFLNKLEYNKNTYIFITCTYGGYAVPNAFPTIKHCVDISKSKGGTIHGRFYVRFPMNNLDYDHIPVPIERDSSTILHRAEKKLSSIILQIKKRRSGNILTQTIINSTLGQLLKLAKKPLIDYMRTYAQVDKQSKLTYHELLHITDRSIEFDEKRCNSCGLCEKVCPVNNIILKDGKPTWLHKCELCFACDEWCSKNAIHHWSKTIGKNYHHPDVTIKDILQQKE